MERKKGISLIVILLLILIIVIIVVSCLWYKLNKSTNETSNELSFEQNRGESIKFIDGIYVNEDNSRYIFENGNVIFEQGESYEGVYKIVGNDIIITFNKAYDTDGKELDLNVEGWKTQLSYLDDNTIQYTKNDKILEYKKEEDNFNNTNNDVTNPEPEVIDDENDDSSKIDINEKIYSSNEDYEITVRDEVYANIALNKAGVKYEKEFQMDAPIDKYETLNLSGIGKVALVSEAAGEYCKVNVYQLVGDEIKLIGNMDCGSDMSLIAKYTYNKLDESKIEINSYNSGERLSNEFELNAAIADIKTVDILGYGSVVLVAETGGEYYGIQVYRLSQDYNTGKSIEIKNVGFLEMNF